jgi:hypothetical protein
VIPFIILTARIIVTGLETVRASYSNRGYVHPAACIGRVKTGIRLLSTGLVLTNGLPESLRMPCGLWSGDTAWHGD